MTKRIRHIRNQLQNLGNRKRAEISQRFFKTAPGEYGEGDVFLGVKVPELRKLAKEEKNLTIRDIGQLLKSPIHEERLLALLILVRIFQKGNEIERMQIYELYLENTQFINNWDLVDTSAEHIIGTFLMDKVKTPLYRLAKSKSLWEKRISI